MSSFQSLFKSPYYYLLYVYREANPSNWILSTRLLYIKNMPIYSRCNLSENTKFIKYSKNDIEYILHHNDMVKANAQVREKNEDEDDAKAL